MMNTRRKTAICLSAIVVLGLLASAGMIAKRSERPRVGIESMKHIGVSRLTNSAGTDGYFHVPADDKDQSGLSLAASRDARKHAGDRMEAVNAGLTKRSMAADDRTELHLDEDWKCTLFLDGHTKKAERDGRPSARSNTP